LAEEEGLSDHHDPSPDLLLLDYFLWDHLKSGVYKMKPRNLEDLRHQILEKSALIELDFFRNAMTSCYYRMHNIKL